MGSGKLRLLLPTILALTVFTVLSKGQDYRAKVQGTVTDPTRAVVVGAKVTLTNVNTGVSAVRETTPDGHYVFDLVEPGTYTVIGRTGRVQQSSFRRISSFRSAPT